MDEKENKDPFEGISPMPWEPDTDDEQRLVVRDAEGNIVAQVFGDYADAEAICKAVNQHKTLAGLVKVNEDAARNASRKILEEQVKLESANRRTSQVTDLARRLAQVVQLYRLATVAGPESDAVLREAKEELGVSRFGFKTVKVEAAVRYPEDAKVNGKDEDNDNPAMPFLSKRKGDYGDEWVWKLEIDAATGAVMDWPKETVAKVWYKVCDECKVEIEGIPPYEEYVPDFLSIDDEGYGDYINLTIADGIIQNWNGKAVEEWVGRYMKARLNGDD